jgi:hypothetical protein
MYKELTTQDAVRGEKKYLIKDNGNGNFISFEEDPDNTDYQAYLAWLAEGNEPTPADQPE